MGRATILAAGLFLFSANLACAQEWPANSYEVTHMFRPLHAPL